MKFPAWSPGIVAVVLTLATATACSPRTDGGTSATQAAVAVPAVSATVPVQVREAVKAFSGLPSSEITYRSVDGGYRGTYKQHGQHVAVEVGADGTLGKVRESVEYVPYAPSVRNRLLDAAASPAEDLLEAAIARDRAAVVAAAARVQGAAGALQDQIPQEFFTPIASLRDDIKRKVDAGDDYAAATGALELYGMLQLAHDTSETPVPVEVAMLDFAGFRAELMTSAPQPDWNGLTQAAAEARTQWQRLQAKLDDKNLAAVTAGIVQAYADGAKARNLAATNAAGQQLLAVVDLLEQHFDQAYKTR